MLLAADVGGTRTRLGLFEEGDLRTPVRTDTFPSAEFDDLESLCSRFLDGDERATSIRAAGFGVAGPVVDRRAETTNLPWTVDADRLGSSLGIDRVGLFNDLVAMGHSIPRLSVADLRTIRTGAPGEAGHASGDGPVAIVAPGTGLGIAYGVGDGDGGYRVVASEGGHADFAPVGELQEELLSFLRQKYERVSYERVCSGSGLPNLYEFLREGGHAPEPPWLARRLDDASDPTPIIVEAGLDEGRPCELCRRTLRLFAAILGAKAGNEALAVVALGGVYLGGGMPRHLLPVLEDGTFVDAFLRKEPMRDILERVPVHVIATDHAPLIGAACLGGALLRGA